MWFAEKAKSTGNARGSAYFVPADCRIAIRLCVGYLPSGRESYRTVNIRGVRIDVGPDDVAAVVRAVEPLLDGRVIGVRVVRRYTLARPLLPAPMPLPPYRFTGELLLGVQGSGWRSVVCCRAENSLDGLISEALFCPLCGYDHNSGFT